MESIFAFRKNRLFDFFFILTLVGFSTFSITQSLFIGDDWPNSQTPYWIIWRYGALNPSHVLNEALYWNNEWMSGQGRLYITHWIESRFIFSYLTSIEQYKFLQWGLLLLAQVLFVTFIYMLTKSHTLTISTAVFLVPVIQFRQAFDPHLSFASMVPSMLSKFFGSLCIFVIALRVKKSYHKILLGVTSATLYLLALTTYEYAALLFPIFVLTFLFSFQHDREDITKSIWNLRDLFPLFILTFTFILYLVVVFAVLRPNATSISGAYVLGISWKTLPTFLTHILAAIPYLNLGISLSSLSYIEIAVSIAIGILMLLAYINTFIDRRGKNLVANRHYFDTKNSNLKIILLLTIALIMWFTPAAMVSFQVAWWDKSSFQTPYLGVLVQEFGIALLCGIGINLYFGGRNIYTRIIRKS